MLTVYYAAVSVDRYVTPCAPFSAESTGRRSFVLSATDILLWQSEGYSVL
jgi:hypothetical protein